MARTNTNALMGTFAIDVRMSDCGGEGPYIAAIKTIAIRTIMGGQYALPDYSGRGIGK